jgi:predicted Na+-dependent transporter
MLFIILHVVGYLLAFRQERQNKISICIGMAYMNNGLAIVLAAKYFDPHILVFVLLSELPWDTLIVPFKKVLAYI